jgi:hypothetical protein
MNEIILAATAALAILAGGLSVYAHGFRTLKMRKRVIVSTTSDYGVSGVLHKRTSRVIVLRNAHVQSEADRPPVPMDGELVIDRDQILFVQVVS